ncbi:uncharacterized protein VTP21DRAFT_7204 [Calcarisporiella thermophila]|uniref:uncharacterized protein n=1 Tax=Calcarisporiella thermophila TaxID=911321 RepID=UPI003743C95D
MNFLLGFLLIFLICIHPNSVVAEETERDAARLARELVRDTTIGTLMSVMKNGTEFEGYPFGSVDYFSDACPTSTGDPIMLLSDIQMNTRNAKAMPKVSLTVRDLRPGSYPVAKARLTLYGELEPLSADEIPAAKKCMQRAHPETKWWMPPDDKEGAPFHDFHFYRLRTRGVYYIGGFGGLHYIGYINNELYHSSHPTELVFQRARFSHWLTFWR